MNTPERKPKIMLAIQDITADYGIVYACGPNMPIGNEQLSELEAVGTWSRTPEYLYLELTTSIDALQDILIQQLVRIRELMIQDYGSMSTAIKHRTRRDHLSEYNEHSGHRIKRAQASEEPVNVKSLNHLRDMLKRRSIQA